MTVRAIATALAVAALSGCSGGETTPGAGGYLDVPAGATDSSWEGEVPVDPTGGGDPAMGVPDDPDSPGEAQAADLPGDGADLDGGTAPEPTDPAGDGDGEAVDAFAGEAETAGEAEAISEDAADPGPQDAPAGDPGPLTAAKCFAELLPASGTPLIDYDQFAPVIGSHCKGTNHQDIQGVERVVFAGDSMTVGTPPTSFADWYRNRVAAALAKKFGLKPPGLLWQQTDLTNGVSLQQSSGDFWCCAKFGARTDDLTDDPHRQLITCNPPEERERRTLIIMTVGGNDIFAWAQDLVAGVPVEQLWADAEKAVKDLEESIQWVKDPSTFPNGVFVVFANTFEFTDEDSANDLAKCPGASIIEMDWALTDPAFLALSTWFTTEYMRIATETGTDMVFFGEAACGHGYMRDVPEGRCYRGPGATLWLDITCMHPNAGGHAGLTDLFLSVIEE